MEEELYIKIDEILKKYKNYQLFEVGNQSSTISEYLRDIGFFLKWILDKGKNPLNINIEDIREYLYTELKNKKKNTISKKISSIKSFYKFLEDQKLINYNPAYKLRLPKKDKLLPHPITAQEVRELLNTVKKPRDKAIIALLYASGIRVSELCNLKLKDIDFNKKTIRVLGKGRKERIVFIGEYATNILKEYIQNFRNDISPNEKVFPLKRTAVFNIVNRAGKKIGIDISPHTLRHTYATERLNNNVDLRSIQEELGHSDISTTQIYLKVSTVNQKYKDRNPLDLILKEK